MKNPYNRAFNDHAPTISYEETEKQVHDLFISPKPETNLLLADVADKCGYYFAEFEGVLLNLASTLLRGNLDQKRKILATDKVQLWLAHTLRGTTQMAKAHPFPRMTTTADGYKLLQSINVAEQQYPFIRGHEFSPIDTDLATLDFSARILESTGLTDNLFQPNALAVVSKQNGMDALFRCANPQEATLDKMGAIAYKLYASPLIQANTQKRTSLRFY